MKGTLMEQKTEEIYSMFTPVEGFNYVYYGKIRNGKTYAATADIHELLMRGEVVMANWHIDWSGFDQRTSFFTVFIKLLTNKPYFYSFKPTNFKFLDVSSPTFIKDINDLVGVHLFIDEGQWIFNSHLKTDDVDKRRLVLEGGQYCRSLNVITQRPSNILKDVRSQVHVWYKCEKVLHWGKLIRFVRWSIEDMKDDLPIDPEDQETKPPRKSYWLSKKIADSYDTHARRSKDAITIEPDFDVYTLTQFDKLSILFDKIVPLSWRNRFTLKRKRLSHSKTIFDRLDEENKTGWNLKDLSDSE